MSSSSVCHVVLGTHFPHSFQFVTLTSCHSLVTLCGVNFVVHIQPLQIARLLGSFVHTQIGQNVLPAAEEQARLPQAQEERLLALPVSSLRHQGVRFHEGGGTFCCCLFSSNLIEFLKIPEVTLCGCRGYKPSINK